MHIHAKTAAASVFVLLTSSFYGNATAARPGSGGTAPSANVVVDAARPASDSGGDDLAAARRMFGSSGYPESNGGLESSATLIAGIGQRISRTINAEDSSYLDGSGAFVSSNRLTWNLEWIGRYNLVPHIVVGQRQPAFIATPAPQWDPAAWAQYQDYATKLVRWVLLSANGTGFNEAIFEVGNEVDITQTAADLWTLPNPNVPQGDATRYRHYMNVYAVWAKAVAQVAAENPGRVLKIAGPAMGGQSLFLSGALWHQQFVADVASAGLRLDLLTLHFYGDVLNGWANVPNSSLRTLLQTMRAAVNASGLAGTRLYVSEYGPSEGSDATFGHINYSTPSAAWGAVFISEALAGTADGGNLLVVRDNFGPNTTGSPTVASLDYIENGTDYPKPIYNAFKEFALLPGSRTSVETPATRPNVRAFASAAPDSAGLIVYNYNYRFNYPSDYTDVSTNEAVTVRFDNLPFDGPVTVDRYLVDAVTSNVGKYIDAGRPPSAAGAALTNVQSCTSKATGGSVTLPAVTLGPSAVSLWIVKSGASSRVKACR